MDGRDGARDDPGRSKGSWQVTEFAGRVVARGNSRWIAVVASGRVYSAVAIDGWSISSGQGGRGGSSRLVGRRRWMSVVSALKRLCKEKIE